MPTVAVVRLRNSSRDWWFDPAGSGVADGDHVVVSTAKGTEIGLCTRAALEVDESEIENQLKSIVRVATERDLERADELAARSTDALSRFRELADGQGLDMKPVDVSFSFEGKRATFYFTAANRIDYRFLVRELSREYDVRVEMRQIGDRDAARMIGGFGHCGEELCCARLPGKFGSVGIRMAKDQDLSLSPDKINGACGRLMCCLRYEFDAYKEFKSRSPKKGALIDTPQGKAKVVDFDMPNDSVRLRFADGQSMKVPVASMDTGGKTAPEGQRVRPCHISQEKFDELIEELREDRHLALMASRSFSSDSNLADKTAKPGAVEQGGRKRKSSSGGSGSGGSGSGGSGSGGSGGSGKSGGSGSSGGGRKRRRRRGGRGRGKGGSGGSGGGSQGSQQAASKGGSGGGQRDQRKARRSVSVATGEVSSNKNASSAAKNGSSGGKNGVSGGKNNKPRPGQHSSTVSGS